MQRSQATPCALRADERARRCRVYSDGTRVSLRGWRASHSTPLAFEYARSSRIQDFVLYFCIPAYNEAPTVGLLLWRLRKVFQE